VVVVVVVVVVIAVVFGGEVSDGEIACDRARSSSSFKKLTTDATSQKLLLNSLRRNAHCELANTRFLLSS
jgi:Sec-independent protein translocase protein TatA